MALIKCCECGQMISDRAEKCPKCGNPVDKGLQVNQSYKVDNQSKFHFGWFLLYTLVPPIIGVFVFLLQKDKRPRMAYSALYGAILSFVFYMLMFA